MPKMKVCCARRQSKLTMDEANLRRFYGTLLDKDVDATRQALS